MRRLIPLLVLLLLLLAGCGKSKVVTCDHCGAQITLGSNSNITDEWIVFCKDCEESLFGDNPVISPG